jgi:hypothetical protein
VSAAVRPDGADDLILISNRGLTLCAPSFPRSLATIRTK